MGSATGCLPMLLHFLNEIINSLFTKLFTKGQISDLSLGHINPHTNDKNALIFLLFYEELLMVHKDYKRENILSELKSINDHRSLFQW